MRMVDVWILHLRRKHFPWLRFETALIQLAEEQG